MPFREIMCKDLLLLVRDRRALVVLILLPMAFICILGLSTGRLLGWRNDNQLLKLGVVDQSNSRQSKLILERLQSIDGINADTVASEESAEQRLNDRDISAVVVIGPEFESRVSTLEPRDIFDVGEARMKISLADVGVRIVSRPASAMVRSVVDQLVLFSTLQAVLPDSARRSEARSRMQALLLGTPDDTDETSEEASRNVPEPAASVAEAPEAAAEEATSGNPVYQTLVPAYTVMFAFFLVTIMARSFIAERELGTLKRLQIAPVSAIDLVLGKTLPFLVISLVQSAVLFIFGRLLFEMSWGNQPLLLLPIIFSTSLAATGMGLLVATLVRTDSQVSAYANFLVITLAGISGCFMPRDWLPEVMQTVSLGTPHAWSLIAYHEALTSPSPRLGKIFEACGYLSAFAVVFASLGCLKMHFSRD